MRFNKILAALLLASPLTAIAGQALKSTDLISANDNLLTFDRNTGLEWLDVSVTKGLTVDQVLAGEGGWLGLGFRYATFGDLSTMLANGGLSSSSTAAAGSKEFLDGFQAESGAGLSLPGMLGPTTFHSPYNIDVLGFAQIEPCPFPSRCETSPLWDYSVRITGRYPSPDSSDDSGVFVVLSDDQIPSSSLAFPEAGSWLVRERTASVPEPGTLGLFAIGLIGIAVSSKRLRNTAREPLRS